MFLHSLLIWEKGVGDAREGYKVEARERKKKTAGREGERGGGVGL